MQVPEKLALIGGSVLLSSVLIFTLKSQASNILPKISSGTSTMFKGNDGKSDNQTNKDNQDSNDKQANQQKQADQAFNDKYQQAQKKHWTTGQWGTAKYYIDDGMNLHIGSGQLKDPLEDTIGHDKFKQIKTINLDGKVQAPQNSYDLFGFIESDGINDATNQINGLNNLNTSQATNMRGMFEGYGALNSLDVSHLNTSHVINMSNMFSYDKSLSNLDLRCFDTSHVIQMEDMFYDNDALANLNVSHFDTSRVIDMRHMFNSDGSLTSLDLSHFDTSDVVNIDSMLYGINTSSLTLGANTKLNKYVDLRPTYHQGNQTLALDHNAHPGTWVKQ